MIAGKSTPDQAPARLFAYRRPRRCFSGSSTGWSKRRSTISAWQIEAGVEAVQIFDTWAGVLPFAEFERWCLAPVEAIVAGLRLRHKNARVIGFPKGVGAHLLDFAARTGVDALGLDSTIDPQWAARNIRSATSCCKAISIRWRSSPAARRWKREFAQFFRRFAGRPHIFNLGHGIVPQTPVRSCRAYA